MADYSSTQKSTGMWTEGIDSIAGAIETFLNMKNNLAEKKQKRDINEIQMQQMKMQLQGTQRQMQDQEALRNDLKSLPTTKPLQLPEEDVKSAYTPEAWEKMPNEEKQKLLTSEVPKSVLERIDDVLQIHMKHGLKDADPSHLAAYRKTLLEKQAGSLAQQADAKYDDIQTKLLTGEEINPIDYAWSKAYEKRKTLSANAYGQQRMNIMMATPVPVIDEQGNLTYKPKGQLAGGGNIPAVQGSREMARTSLFEDIKGASSNVKMSLEKMQEFTTTQRAQLAVIMSSPDPHSSWNMWMKSNIATTLSKEQIDYVTDLLQLKENAYALRPILGAGQGSDELRTAIAQTLPSALSGDKAMAATSLNKFDQQIARLRRGLPGVRIQPEKGKEGEQPTKKKSPYPRDIWVGRAMADSKNKDVSKKELEEYWDEKYTYGK